MLVDTCATAKFTTIDLVNKLQLTPSKCCFSVGALDHLTTTVNVMVSITFKSVYNEHKRTLNFLIVPNISDFVPNQLIPRERIRNPKNISLADPKFQVPAPIDMLIGAGVTLSLFSIGIINLSQDKSDLYLQKTRLGWIIAGDLEYSKKSITVETSDCLFTELKAMVEKFLSVEEILTERSNFSQEEIECENHFKHYVTRDDDGRFIVALPFKSMRVVLEESKQNGLKSLNGLLKRFENNSQLKTQYTAVIQEYLDLNHMSLIKSTKNSEGFYLPHHVIMQLLKNQVVLQN
ncbi:uncharacterized protein LOC117169843 [Belonocnema kinseyi]|uniref:uncharacterized protein LOC117169843 n=1 Tax=Belonocnema kinseyi TaxID=2817044 RepID=UPI00143CD865|nr:uncharacterized protein LOC117169843 [Belonocnema kinseyi]